MPNKTVRMTSVDVLVKYARDGYHGRDWYVDATRDIDRVSRDAGWDCSDFAGILAVTSPRCAVRRNIRLGLHVMKVGVLPDGVMRSIHTSVRNFQVKGEINGPKTYAFYNALMGCADSVVLDVWMAYALGVDQKLFPRKDVQSKAVARVKRVARVMGISPAATQACIWTGYRARAGFAYLNYPVWEEYCAARNV